MEGTRHRPPADDGADPTGRETTPDGPVLVTDHDVAIPLPWKFGDKAVGTKDGIREGRSVCEAAVQTNGLEEVRKPVPLSKKTELDGQTVKESKSKSVDGSKQSEATTEVKVVEASIGTTQTGGPETSVPTVTPDVEMIPDVPPVAPPRKSPSKRKRTLAKRVRKRTGGETGETVRKLDPTTSEEEVEPKSERPEDRWKREDDEKRKIKEKKDDEKRRQEEEEQKDLEEWTELLRRHKAEVEVDKSETESKTKKDKPRLEKKAENIKDSTEAEKNEKKAQKDKTEVKKTQEKKESPNEMALAKPPPLQVAEIQEQRPSWWKFWRRVPKETPEKETKVDPPKKEKDTKESNEPRESNKEIYKQLLKETWRSYKEFKQNNRGEWNKIVKLGNKCLGELFIVIMLCGAGAFVFRFTEAAFENFYKCGVKRIKRDFVDELWKGSTYLQEEEWKSRARKKLMEMEEQLQSAFEASVTTYSGHKSWSFINSLLYSLTVVTTIGYGHIAPATTTGKALTIVYAVIGIPMFLILLADFGKLFTRGIKWIWAFVRRLYYTGSCKKVRKTAPVQEVMKGVQLVYDMAAFRRPSSQDPQQVEPETVPSTPAPSNFVIDEEFNLPITLAIFILVLYMFCGAVVFWIWEDWSFFDAFYFVFISMSTIGFGDLVPQNKMYMMASIVYLAFGLALTSMCINVVQEKLSDTFRQASTKIGATIGLKIKGASADQLDLSPGSAPVELALVHKTSTPSAAAV